MLGRCPKARRRLRLLNTALHLAELVRLLAVFPRMMQSIILQRQFELIHLGFTPTPLSGTPAGHSITFNPNLYVHLLCPPSLKNMV